MKRDFTYIDDLINGINSILYSNPNNKDNSLKLKMIVYLNLLHIE